MRGAGEPSILAGITADLTDEFGLDRQQVFAAGLSAGGAMAAVMGETYPELYAAVGIHSGLAYGSAQDVVSAFAAMRGRSEPSPADRPRARPISRRHLSVRSCFREHGPRGSSLERRTDRALPAGISRRTMSRSAAGGIDGRTIRARVTVGADGHPAVEFWLVEGAGHAWSGGHPDGSYTDPTGPDASREMIRFFFAQSPTISQ